MSPPGQPHLSIFPIFLKHFPPFSHQRTDCSNYTTRHATEANNFAKDKRHIVGTLGSDRMVWDGLGLDGMLWDGGPPHQLEAKILCHICVTRRTAEKCQRNKLQKRWQGSKI